MSASSSGAVHVVKLIMKSIDANDKDTRSKIVNAENDQRSTSLHYAASKGIFNSIYFKNSTTHIIPTTIGHCEIIQILIENGSKKNHPNKYGTKKRKETNIKIDSIFLFQGQTPLIRAVSANQQQAVQLLLELGCDPSRCDNDENNLLMIAALAQSREMLLFLLKIRYLAILFHSFLFFLFKQ